MNTIIRKATISLILAGSVLCLWTSVSEAVWCDARSIAMGSSFTAVARGYNSIGFNPANLGLSDNPPLQIQLLALGSTLDNNSFSINDYNRYNGAELSEADRHDILSMIPDDGLRLRGSAAASTLSFSIGRFVLSTTGEAEATGSLSRDVVELAFFGNVMGETIDSDVADGEAVAHADLNLAYGYPAASFSWGELAVGMNVKYIKGLAYTNISRASATASTEISGIDADGSVLVRTATGGSGMGLDLGVAAIYRDKWTFSAGVRNVASYINWNSGVELSEYVFSVNSFNAETADDSTVVESEEFERSIDGFNSTLVPTLNIGAARHLGDFLVASDIRLRLKDVPGSTSRPEFAVGTEYGRLGFMPLRAGMSFGGFRGMSLALGFGLKFSTFHIDLAWASSGTMMPSIGRGFSLAFSTGFDFTPRLEEEGYYDQPHTPPVEPATGPHGI